MIAKPVDGRRRFEVAAKFYKAGEDLSKRRNFAADTTFVASDSTAHAATLWEPVWLSAVADL